MTDTLLSQGSTVALDDDRHVDPALRKLARQAAVDGVVLLRNDGALPLEGRVSVFGRGQVDWMTVGYGSGGDVNAAYTTVLLDCLEEADGVQVNAELADVYRRWCAANPVEHGTWGAWPRSYPEMPMVPDPFAPPTDAAESDDEKEPDPDVEALVAAAAAVSDVAVVVIGRAAGEDRDNTLDPGSYYLTADERALLAAVTSSFERTVVVVNTGNLMDFAWIEEYAPSAVLLAWLGGMEGGAAVAHVLTGAAEPTGRLAATVARDYADYPSAANFGSAAFNNYSEDVFVGYRYFETFAPDKVLYPFGFGLSYTTFDIGSLVSTRDAVDSVDAPRLNQRLSSPSAESSSVGSGELSSPLVEPGRSAERRGRVETNEPGPITLTATVTNTGARAGRQVVQAYQASPVGALSQPARQLVAFAKTGVLQPGESVEVELSFELLPCYDDSGATGHRSAYVLEPGEYRFFVGADVRGAAHAGAVSVSELVVRQLEEAAAPVAQFPRMTNTSGELGWEAVPTATVDLPARILSRLPGSLEPTSFGLTWADVVSGQVSLDAFIRDLPAEDLAALCYGDRTMNSPLGAPGNAGALGGVTEGLRRRGVPPVTTTDGPSGLRFSSYASLLPCGTALASTWDLDLVEALSAGLGEEMLRKGSDVLLSPGMNIQRDPLCGRNFEYFSEDPLVSGRSAGAVVRGVQSAGGSACPKHFAANNQEFKRITNDSRVSERALREVYLRGFEIVVGEAAPKNIMTSYNKVNGVWSYYHYDLVTTILRGEWGYAGNIVTDWWTFMADDPNFPGLRDGGYRVRAQVDVLMPGGRQPRTEEVDSGVVDGLADGVLTLGEVQRTARNVLRQVLANAPALAREVVVPDQPRREFQY